MGSYDVATVLALYEREQSPVTEPMHGSHGEVRRNPSTDQKKVRRQMTKKAADEATTESIPALLARAASAKTLAEQETLMTEVEQRTTARYASLDAEGSLDLSVKEAVEIVPRGLHEMHTAQTDWLMGDGMRVTASTQDSEHALVAEAAMWFGRCPDFVKEDQEEFRTQARNLGRREASRYGDAADAAFLAFVAETERLYRQGSKTGAFQVKTAALIPDLDGGGLVEDHSGHVVPGVVPGAGEPKTAPHQTPKSGPQVDTSLPETKDLSATPHLESEVDRLATGQDAQGVREQAQGYAGHVLRGGSLQSPQEALNGFARTAALHGQEDEHLAAVLAGGGDMTDPVGAAQDALDSSSNGVRDDAQDFAASQVSDQAHQAASQVPQVGLPTQEFSTGVAGYPDIPTDSNRAPAIQEIQNYQGFSGTSVVPPGNNGAQAANGDTEPEKDFAGTQGFPVSGSHAARVAAQMLAAKTPCPVPGEHHSNDRVTVNHGADSPTTMCGYHASDLNNSLKKIRNSKESKMDYAACPHCSGSGHVAVRKQAYSGLPQIDQIVNADESPGTQPAPGQSETYPSQVAFPLTGLNPGNVQSTIQQAEQQIASRPQGVPVGGPGGAVTAAQYLANGRDNSGWMGDMGAKGTDYPGYSTPAYDGSNNLGQPDPVYGFGGDQQNQPLSPYGEMEANDETNVPSQPYDPSGPHNADQGQGTVSPTMSTAGSYHPDPYIASAQQAIVQAQQAIAARNQQLAGQRG